MTVRDLLRTHRASVRYLACAAISITLLTTTTTDTVRAIRAAASFFLGSALVPAHRLVSYPADVSGRLLAAIYAAEENRRLRELVKRMHVYKMMAEQLERDADRARAVLGTPPMAKRRLLNARVVRREPNQWFSSFLIARGSNDGIVPDAPVLTDRSMESVHLIGRIWHVEAEVSRVLMITDPLSGVPVSIVGKTAQGVLLGNGTPYPTIEYLPPESDAAPGDRVVTASVLDSLAGNLEVGTVLSIEVSRKTGFKSARVLLSGNLNCLDDVLVLVP